MMSRQWSTLSRRARLRSPAVGPRRDSRPALLALSGLATTSTTTTTTSPPAVPGSVRSMATAHDAAAARPEAGRPRAPAVPGHPASWGVPWTTAPASKLLSSRPTSPADLHPVPPTPRRGFHNYFVTHLPSSSMHPDRGRALGPGHGLPRDASTPHTRPTGHSPATIAGPGLAGRDMTVVRIPLRSAKHHFGSATSRGTRPYNEDTEQAGTIDMPAFAKRAPISLVRKPSAGGAAQTTVTSADSSFGDPQIFYFAVFDGHGGDECSQFLKDELHGYIEEASEELGLLSSLGKKHRPGVPLQQTQQQTQEEAAPEPAPEPGASDAAPEQAGPDWQPRGATHQPAIHGSEPLPARVRNIPSALHKFTDLIEEYKDTVGGYFRRFHPTHFPIPAPPYSSSSSASSSSSSSSPSSSNSNNNPSSDPTTSSDPTAAEPHPHPPPITVESVLEYAFLRADLDFVTAQARKPDPAAVDAPLDSDATLGPSHATPSGRRIGGRSRFRGGSTASVALVSTPTPAPFWHPSAHATLTVAHVGDTRIVLCDTATGLAVPLTSDHHPTTPGEASRLRRYAPTASLVTGDSFGEHRISGLANSRAFGDTHAKRIGVSAEPEITRVEMGPAQYSFLVLCSDGVSGTLSDQEMVDVVKEASTPTRAAADVVGLATEISSGDNATCQVVRLGGWERRLEGGLGSLATREVRELRRVDAADPRRKTR